MSYRNGHPALTPQERIFAKAVADTGDKVYAAKEAGYRGPARVTAQKATSRPAVQAEIVRASLDRLHSEALPMAVGTLIAIMSDAKMPAGARVQAAKLVFDRTLGSQDAGDVKQDHELTANEIARRIDALSRIAMERARDVTPEAPSSVSDAFG